jgi:hypothetical protein
MSALELDPTLLEALRTLAEHDVEFVVVGDVAEAIHNDGGFVSGLAIVPGRYGRNVARLSGALQAMNAQLGIAGTPAETDIDLRRTDLRELAPCSFITRYVDIDVNFEPRGTNGYQDLFDDATHIELAAGIRPLVAAREDLARIARGTPPVALPPDLGDARWSSQEIRASRPTRT